MRFRHIVPVVAAFVLAACSSQESSLTAEQATHAVAVGEQGVKPQVSKTEGDQVKGDTVPSIAPEVPVKPPVPRVPGVKVSSVSVPTKTVALTFDDGPHGTLTPQILDVLARYNAKCTFFVLGSNVQRYPGIVSRMVSEGHEVANHSWSHANLATASYDTVSSQISRTNEAIMSACGRKPRLMRPPYGACNAALTSRMKSEYGLTTVLWSVDTNDWRKPGTSAIVSRAVNGARPGSIILVHDIHTATANAIEGIVKGLTERGYEFVTVSTLMNRGYQYANSASRPPTIVTGVTAPVSSPAPLPIAVPETPFVPMIPAPAVVPAALPDDRADEPR